MTEGTTATAPAAFRTDASLSDGRTIRYYDAGPGRVAPPDLRGLDPVRTASEIRYDPLQDQWVVIASHRQGRTFLPPADECPLCPSRDGRLTEIPAEDYEVVVFDNRFPSLAQDVPGPEPFPPVDGVPSLVERRAGVGRCEVVCFTSDHDASLSSLSPERVRLVVEAWADRTAELSRLPGVEHVFPFENRGVEIGVTLRHPHGQIYGYPFVPPRTLRMLAAAQRYRDETGGDLYGRLLDDVLGSGEQVVAQSEHWVAFVPRAARWPFEVHLYPRRHAPDLVALTDDERADFAPLYLDVLRGFDAVFVGRDGAGEADSASTASPMPYISAWQQAPVRQGRDVARLFLQVFSIRRAPGKLKYLAGSESAAGVWINDVTPEQAAAMLRAAVA